MDKAAARGREFPRTLVQGAEKKIVAHERPRRIRKLGGNVLSAQFFDDPARGKGRKISVRRAGDDRLIHGLCPRIVGNAGVAQVDGHALNANAVRPAVLPDGQHRVRPQLIHRRAQRGTGGVKLRRDLALCDRHLPDALGQALHCLPRGVDLLAAEGREARDKDLHRTASSPIIRRMISLSVSRIPSRAMLLTARMVFSTPLTMMPSPP